MNIKNLITKLILNKDLSDSELNYLFHKIINAEINENLISAIFNGRRCANCSAHNF